ncbi:MAG TPA: methionine--tRNA ligase [Candidatus Magasanikbacteria bacterium]|nr:methionine--tRNA ligase [Candidatus Magasanikbacteria bacterium]
MKTKKPFYISTAIPYVNARPHIGYALECVQTDARARFERLQGRDVFFLTGTDENSLKNVQAAEKAGEKVEKFVDEHAENFKELKTILNISYNDFIRTTEKRHFDGAQKLWEKFKPEDIYKKEYKGLYCVGCEAFYIEEELIDGKLCPEHKKPVEIVEEENYFFKLGNYSKQLRELVEKNVIKIYPEARKNEWLAFIDRGLEDFSISRSHERAHGWGVPVPGDDSQIMYVWVDALSNYITALDYSGKGKEFETYWIQNNDRQVAHVIGKGIGKFHVLYWPAFLLSAEVPLPTEIFIHGYVTVEGEKISKSLGNVIDPGEVVEKYGVDATRYYLLGAIPAAQDGDFSYARFEEFYTAHLANGIGNLTHRILTMLEKYTESKVPEKNTEDIFNVESFWKEYLTSFEHYSFDEVIQHINKLTTQIDTAISSYKPWEKAKAGEDITGHLYQISEGLFHLGVSLLPLIPSAAEKILVSLGVESGKLVLSEITKWGNLEAGQKIKKGDPVFPRLEKE